MIGVDYQTSTYIHLVEVIHWNKRLADDPQAEYIGLKRPELGEYWERLGPLRQERWEIPFVGCFTSRRM